jgi:hypothetical protein
MEGDREEGLRKSWSAAVTRRGTFHTIGSLALVTFLASACADDPKTWSDWGTAGAGASSGAGAGTGGASTGSGGSDGPRGGSGGDPAGGGAGEGDGGSEQGGQAGLGSAGEMGAGGVPGTGGAPPSGDGGEAGQGQGGSFGGGGGGGVGGTSGSGGTAGTGGEGGSDGSTAGTGGTGDPDPDPDPCEGVPAWSPTESWTNYEVDEKRVVSGQVWRCKNPMFCHTYPGHQSSNSWILVGDCHDPNAGGSPACQCSSGTCCDGCYFRPQSHFCGEVPRDSMCSGNAVPACPGAKRRIELDYWNLFCNGDSNQCTRWAVHTKYSSQECAVGTVCIDSGGGDLSASCKACPSP